MADIANVTNRLPTAAVGRADGYRAMREVKALARVAEKSDSTEARQALLRLNRILANGQPLRGDVPRGYYLNFTV
jgi:hypothetical protein